MLVSDNNFSPTQFTQFLAFEVQTTHGVPDESSAALLLLGGVSGLALLRRR